MTVSFSKLRLIRPTLQDRMTERVDEKKKAPNSEPGAKKTLFLFRSFPRSKVMRASPVG